MTVEISDEMLALQIKGKMGYQEKITYCKDCRFSCDNPVSTERYTLVCNKNGALLTFPTMKMSTCAQSETWPKQASPPKTPEPGADPLGDGNPEEDEPDTPFYTAPQDE